ncbi:GNAT family N-acetyltransferase [Niallia sp. Sow4_A1]|jgi:ribosomal protein S18 acetylase RimI-like enzyme|uniref:GNAT family N-acetyltransferase n=1 Tax=Bacillaceae TaxID=186817 RepID=UPI00065F7E8D|nr:MULTISPECIES: GNAT family N-acetyltransferase [Bacillaceae]MCM3363597.1 GNAT family N-acetyltransferase [Niallia sp. MER TA 168]REB76406.1 N-acetyltransferase [Cutibacterium acnes]CAI9391260.1 Mycothiol acetyltransferase [Bacillus sp. T2.9-1]
MKKNRFKHDDFEYDTNDEFYFIAGHTDGGATFGLRWEDIIPEELNFRPAIKKDAEEVVELIHLAIGDITEQLTGQTKVENIHTTLAKFFREENNRLSYQNVIVADIFDEITGIIVTYSGTDAYQLDKPLLERLRRKTRNQNINFDQEADIGDLYIDTISVSPKFQGYGIGSELLRKAEELALQKGYERISLNVAKDNPYAKKLYIRIGYQEDKEIQINGHTYDYMVKTLKFHANRD